MVGRADSPRANGTDNHESACEPIGFGWQHRAANGRCGRARPIYLPVASERFQPSRQHHQQQHHYDCGGGRGH